MLFSHVVRGPRHLKRNLHSKPGKTVTFVTFRVGLNRG